MAFNKVGELSTISAEDIQSSSSVLAELNNAEIDEKFSKFAQQLRRVAPKADDFLYFTAIMITAAEAAALNPDGSVKLKTDGSPVEVGWEIDEKTGSWKWKTNDPSIQAYANANGDVFPAEEIIKAYKKWAGKPLCLDHRSSEVDAVRGIILDTYYDRKHKRVIGLCALDKKSYPDLARGVTSGYKTSVSMGTAVGKAICYTCGQVARVEREFCNHMRSKTAKEINTELSPIELSIVVSGADPQAKIRTILAAANNISKNLNEKFEEINKLGEDASLTKLKNLEEEVERISKSLSDLKNDLTKTVETVELEKKEKNDADVEETSTNKTATTHKNALESELKELKQSVNEKFAEINNTLKKISSTISEEIEMVNSKQPSGLNKEAYYQSGNSVSDPTPGKPKYPVDPMAEKARAAENSWLNESSEIAPEGLYGDDLDNKKKLLRAELDERALRRAGALKAAKEKLTRKEAYYQSGNKESEPALGKVKYPADPMEANLRKKDLEDIKKNQVGDVTGLLDQPKSKEDELKRKKMLNRASPLQAKFVRVSANGKKDFDKTGWQVSRDGKLLFTASVKSLAGASSEELFDTIATKEFGRKLLAKVQSVGIAKAASLYKSAQDAAPALEDPNSNPSVAPVAAPVEPAVDAEPVEAPKEEMVEDKGLSGDPKETALELAEKLRDDASDLVEAVRLLTGEQAEMGDMEQLSGKKAALAPLFNMKKSLSNALIAGAKRAIADLNDHAEEMNLVYEVASEGLTSPVQQSVVESAFVDARAALNNARKIMASCVSYVRGSEKLEKQASMLADEDNKADDLSLSAADLPEDPEMNAVDDMEANCDSMNSEDEMHADEMNADEMNVDDMHEGKECWDADDVNHLDCSDVNDENDVMDTEEKMESKASGELNLLSKEGRAQMRAKLAAQALAFSPVLEEAHKLVDTSPLPGSKDLVEFENVNEAQEKDLEVARQVSPRVRKEAERLNDLIVKGKVSVAQLDKFAEKGLDPEVIKYWKEYFAEGDKTSKEFGEELLKAHAKAQIDAELSKHKIKLSRAYELANEMVRRGMLNDEHQVIASYVDNEIMNWNDEGFESMKRVIAKTPVRKVASVVQVGAYDNGLEQVKQEDMFQKELDQALFSLIPGRR